MVSVPEGRVCTRCGEWKTLDQFYPHKLGRCGRSSRCKPCEIARALDWQRRNPEAAKAAKQRYGASSQGRERQGEYRREHAEQIRQYNSERLAEKRTYYADWRKRNINRLHELEAVKRAKPEYRTTRRRYRELHPEAERARQRRYYERHRDRRRAAWRAFCAAHPDYHRLYESARRARTKANGGTLTEQEWLAICEAQRYLCLACGRCDPLTIDHIVPISRGGPHVASNVQALCKPCNSRKHDRTIDYRAEAQGDA